MNTVSSRTTFELHIYALGFQDGRGVGCFRSSLVFYMGWGEYFHASSYYTVANSPFYRLILCVN